MLLNGHRVGNDKHSHGNETKMVNIMQQKLLQKFKNLFKYHCGSSWSWEDLQTKAHLLNPVSGQVLMSP